MQYIQEANSTVSYFVTGAGHLTDPSEAHKVRTTFIALHWTLQPLNWCICCPVEWHSSWLPQVPLWPPGLFPLQGFIYFRQSLIHCHESHLHWLPRYSHPIPACSTKSLSVYTSLYRQRAILCDKAQDSLTRTIMLLLLMCFVALL